MLITLIKSLLPGSLLFLILGQAIGVALLFAGPSSARYGRRWLAALLALYAILSLQGTSDLLIRGLSSGYTSLGTPEAAHDADVVVVLGNGARVRSASGQEITTVNPQSAFNALEAARLYRMLRQPMILASGGTPDPSTRTTESEILARALRDLGVPADRIATEGGSRNTDEQAANVANWLESRGKRSFVLVTTREHMFRATRALAARGVTPLPSTSWLRYGGNPWWRPTLFSLEGSREALYEYLAVAYYWMTGRL